MKEPGEMALAAASAIAFPRLCGSAGERKARERISAALREAGLTVEEEWFGASDHMIRVMARWVLAPAAAGAVLGALALRAGMNGAGAAAGFAGFGASFYWLQKASGIAKPRGRTSFTANLLGRPAPADPAKPTFILMAHYDSKSQAFSIRLRIALFILAAVLIGLNLVLLAASAGLQALGAQNPFTPAALPLAAALLVTAALMTQNAVGNLSDGALDNATGVGIVAETAARLAQDPPAGVNILALATAAEEIGLEGAKAFIRAHRTELVPDKTFILNFDGAGKSREIMVMSGRGDPEMAALAGRLARDKGLRFRRMYIPVGMATDLNPFLRTGYRGIDFLGMAVSSHTPDDRMDQVDREALADHVGLAVDLVKGLSETAAGEITSGSAKT